MVSTRKLRYCPGRLTRTSFRYIVLLLSLIIINLSYSFSQTKVSFFYDSDYTETCIFNYCEARNTFLTVQEQGHQIQLIQGVEAASYEVGLTCQEILIIPETEVGNYADDLTSEAKIEIRNFVDNGGGLVMFGSDGQLSNSSSSVENLNSIFGFNLMNAGFASQGYSYLNDNNASGTTFEGGPDSIPHLTTTNLILESSLPSGTKVVYSNSEGASVLIIPWGNGTICYVGWSWFSGGPGNNLDGSVWEEILAKAIDESDIGAAYPSCAVCDQAAPVANSLTNTQIGLDETGSTIIQPFHIDDGSFDDCGIELMEIFIPGNPQNLIDCSALGSQITAALIVYDEVGLSDTSWSEITVVDILPPVQSCPVSTQISCDQGIGPVDFIELCKENNNTVIIDQTTGNQGSSAISFSNIPPGSVIADVDVEITILHPNLAELVIELISPNDLTNVLIFDQGCPGTSGMDIIFDDEGDPFNCGVSNPLIGRFKLQYDQLSRFNGEDPSGTWVLNITDEVLALGGQLTHFAICLTLQEPMSPPIVDDNCEVADTWFVDDVTIDNCGNGNIERTWFAKDNSNNISSCTQTITVSPSAEPTISFPGDFNLNCGAAITDLHPDNLMYPFDYPKYEEESYCGQVNFEYTDHQTDICSPNGIIIERTWLVTDECRPMFELSHVQVLTISDSEAPEGNCPDDITIDLVDDNCEAMIPILIPEDIIDNCDSEPLYSGYEIRNEIGLQVTNPVVAGSYTVICFIEDECGNEGSCAYDVEVQDHVSPIANAIPSTQVIIGYNGIGNLCAEDVDINSSDNCSIQNLLLSKDGLNFSPCITFTCDEIVDPSPIPITLRVIDNAGNMDDDGSIVFLIDNLEPTIFCPPDVTVDCSAAYPFLQEAGTAMAEATCIQVGVSFIDQGYDDCIVNGSFVRVWRVTGINEDIICQQTITIANLSPPIINLPDNVTVDCSDANVQPSVTGFLTFEDGCYNHLIEFEDEIFDICSPGKYIIDRFWTVTNPCNFQVIYSYTQEIRVEDELPPEFINFPEDYTLSANVLDCLGDLNLEDLQFNDQCDPNPILEIEITDEDGELVADPSSVPVGTYRVKYILKDDCGNQIVKFLFITIADYVPPVALCHPFLQVELQAGGIVTVTPSQIDNGSYDLCSDDLSLRLRKQGVVYDFINFDCEDIGENSIELIVYDGAGISAQCQATVIVTDPIPYCEEPPESVQIAGIVRTEYGADIDDFFVYLEGDNGIMAMNGTNGYYEIIEVPTGTGYTLTCEKKR